MELNRRKYQIMKNGFIPRNPDAYTKSSEHGREEYRELWVKRVTVGELPWMTVRTVWVMRSTRTVKGVKTVQMLCGITNLTLNNITPKDLLKTIRDHWAVENNYHWVLDVTMHEDKCRCRKEKSAIILAMLRRLAITICYRHKEGTIPDTRRAFASELKKSFSILGIAL